MELEIKPVEYKGTRLREVGEGVVRTLYPRFDDFRILRPLKLTKVASRYMSTYPKGFPPFFRTNKYTEYSINSREFLFFLLSYYREPLLGITSLPSFDFNGYEMYGQALLPSEGRYSFVSTYPKEFGSVDSDDHIEKLTRMSIHEVGHSFGLQHHENNKPAATNLCPMETGHNEYANESIITWEEYILARSTRLCNDCRGQLGI